MSSKEFFRWAKGAALCSGPLEATALHCHIARVGVNTWPLVVVDELINGNYLIWTLCARLAESGLDQDWTRKFNSQHRSQWVQTQTLVQQTQGVDRFQLDIPLPPMVQAVFTYIDNSMAPRYLTIRSTPAGPRLGAGFLELLRHSANPDRSSTDVFIVTLDEEDVTGGTGVAPGPPPMSIFSRRTFSRRTFSRRT
ncbi:hypothetical protein PENSOL_c001G08971 [Penicillium solitum]|uniref:Uncharacterized protein n=1 Tax=Penicillium solitum TaxID=60172 RepID=A0A1V6RRM6_9EURO|nr:uncharacterized protein PENSOL_c001G08971 [Penicillium solitum]OQE04200.1 hypothetical protein PENSOL_c001G08971 [Penicillium solitum]